MEQTRRRRFLPEEVRGLGLVVALPREGHIHLPFSTISLHGRAWSFGVGLGWRKQGWRRIFILPAMAEESERE
jgi:hypothetical protein